MQRFQQLTQLWPGARIQDLLGRHFNRHFQTNGLVGSNYGCQRQYRFEGVNVMEYFDAGLR